MTDQQAAELIEIVRALVWVTALQAGVLVATAIIGLVELLRWRMR